ncbi:MAG: tryptophanyl-tRNA synthetase [Flavobacteriaceae bacterium]|jgi:tryptophanyl-tRNA synthetase
MKKILLSGIQPSGTPHIGNYFGAMKQFVDFQDTYESYIFVATYHAMTTISDPEALRRMTHDVVLDYLAIGLDPEKVTLYRQTGLTELHELTWILDCLTTVPYLSRAHSYKDKVAKGITPSVGLFQYPVLMAADMLLPNADIVPVGQDQRQHVEIARDIAEKFNATYGDTFKIPEEFIPETVATVPGIDGQKMSKSYGNTISLFGDEKEIEKSIKKIVTDSKNPEDKKNPDECNVFALHRLITPTQQLEQLQKGYEEGGLGYGESKKILFENMKTYFSEMKERRAEFEKKPDYIADILHTGESKMKKKFEERMNIIREKVGL